MTTLKSISSIIPYDKVLIGVNKSGNFIEEFESSNKEKMKMYKNETVIDIHIIGENLLAVNIEINS